MNTRHIIFFLLGIIFFVVITLIILVKIKVLTFENNFNISSILTLLAVLVSMAAFMVTFNSYKTSEKHYDIQEKQKQAIGVAAWFTEYGEPRKAIIDGRDVSLPMGKVYVENSSSVPVYNMFIFMVSNKIESTYETTTIDGENKYNTIGYIELLKPGKTEVTVPANGNASGGQHDSVAIIFRDSSSRYWFRSNFGVLKEISEKEEQLFLRTHHISGPYQQYTNQ